MSWSIFGSKNKTPAASQTNLQAHRAKQIDSLKKAQLNPIEIIPNTEYRITFICGTNNISLIVTLPPQFPQDPPSLSVQPPVLHQWVDTQGKITECPALKSFSMHSSLASVIQSIMEEFRRNPPQIMSKNFGVPGPLSYPSVTTGTNMPPYPNPGYPGYGPPNVSMPTQFNSASPSSTVQSPPNASINPLQSSTIPGSYTVPDINTAFPDLKKKSLTELNDMLNEEDKILEMIQKLPEICKLSEDREKLSNQCIELARENLSKKPIITQLKQWIADKNAVFTETQEEYEKDQQMLISVSDEFHPTNIQSNFKVAIMEAEEESEKIVDQLLDKKMEIEEFTQKFIQTRILCHSRRAKDEKLSSIIAQQGY